MTEENGVQGEPNEPVVDDPCAERVRELETRLRRAEARAEVMLNAFVKLRELTVAFTPFVTMSAGYEPLRKLLLDDEAMEKAIDEILESKSPEGMK